MAAGGAATFFALVLLVVLGLTRETDLATTVALQSVASEALDVLVNWHTLAGQLVVTLTAAVLLAIAVWWRLGGWAWIAPLSLFATGAIELLFKFGLQHPGPPSEFDRAFIEVARVQLEAPSSFPSGHVARLTFLSILLASMRPSRGAWTGAILFIVLTLFARVYIGDHWVSDALAGLALGAAVAAAAVAWMRSTSRDALADARRR